MDRTIAIITFAHCGTTMLAGVLEILGVPMVGENYHRMKWEDHDIIAALKDENEEQFAALVAERNAQHSTWGFKYPGAWKFMPLLKTYLRNPVYLGIFKDPISVTRRRFGKSEDRFLRKVRNTIRQYKNAIDGIYACGIPIHFFSYQKAIASPYKFVLELIEVAGLDIDEDDERIGKAVKYIQPNDLGPRRRYPSVEQWITQ